MTQSREPEPQSRRESSGAQLIEPAQSETLDSYIKRLQDQYCEPLQQATLELTAALAQLQHYALTHELPNQAQFSIDDQALHNSCLYTLNRCISLLQKQHQEAARPHLQQINTDADIRMQSIGNRLRYGLPTLIHELFFGRNHTDSYMKYRKEQQLHRLPFDFLRRKSEQLTALRDSLTAQHVSKRTLQLEYAALDDFYSKIGMPEELPRTIYTLASIPTH